MPRRSDRPAAGTPAGVDHEPMPILFEAALSMRGKCFSLDSEGEAQLVLRVPEQFARVLSDNIHRLRDCSFIVRIEGIGGEAVGRLKGKRQA